MNKIGHALHLLEPDFHHVTLSPKVKEVITKLTSMVKPTVIQSMLIFKQPKIGGEGEYAVVYRLYGSVRFYKMETVCDICCNL